MTGVVLDVDAGDFVTASTSAAAAASATDDDLAPLLDLWFARDDLDLTTKNAWGLSPLDLAKKVPYRAAVVARMERYLSDH